MLSSNNSKVMMRLMRAVSVTGLMVMFAGSLRGQGGGVTQLVASDTTTITSAHVRQTLSALADDSMQGRLAGTAGSRRAARYLAAQMTLIGLKPMGDSGYLQRVPLAAAPGPDGQTTGRLLASWAAFDSTAPADRIVDANVVGVLEGSDPAIRDSVILVDAHYDHLGVGHPVNGDSIYNGADDDASGAVTVLEVARALAAGPRPRRTVVFLLTTGEEVGLLGTNWYQMHPVVPLDRTVANLEIEMTGRPDSIVGGRGHAWLTGDERSTMGERFRAAGLAISPDKRPDQQFFQRSDNIAFAESGHSGAYVVIV